MFSTSVFCFMYSKSLSLVYDVVATRFLLRIRISVQLGYDVSVKLSSVSRV